MYTGIFAIQLKIKNCITKLTSNMLAVKHKQSRINITVLHAIYNCLVISKDSLVTQFLVFNLHSNILLNCCDISKKDDNKVDAAGDKGIRHTNS